MEEDSGSLPEAKCWPAGKYSPLPTAPSSLLLGETEKTAQDFTNCTLCKAAWQSITDAQDRLADCIRTISNITTKQEPQNIITPDSRLGVQRARWRQERKPLDKEEVSTREKGRRQNYPTQKTILHTRGRKEANKIHNPQPTRGKRIPFRWFNNQRMFHRRIIKSNLNVHRDKERENICSKRIRNYYRKTEENNNSYT